MKRVPLFLVSLFHDTPRRFSCRLTFCAMKENQEDGSKSMDQSMNSIFPSEDNHIPAASNRCFLEQVVFCGHKRTKEPNVLIRSWYPFKRLFFAFPKQKKCFTEKHSNALDHFCSPEAPQMLMLYLRTSHLADPAAKLRHLNKKPLARGVN